jgi:sugar phosphate isomerase/epimerase
VDSAANFGIATGAFADERDDWNAAVTRAAAKGWRYIELTAGTENRLDSLIPFLEHRRDALDCFERVSIHAPITPDHSSVPAVAEKLVALAWEFDTVFHPDLYRGEQSLLRLGARVVFENMDNQKRFGQKVPDLRSIFDSYPEAGFCLDVAHVWTNDRTLRLAHDLIESFGPRLRQLHVSGINPDGTHRPTTSADLDLYQPVLARCDHVPWLLEEELSEGPA